MSKLILGVYMSVYRSTHNFLRVTFPPEQFGFGEGADYKFDEQGNRVAVPVPYRPVKFEAGAVKVIGPRDDFMRKHPGNQANGGSAFWEEDQNTTDVVDLMSGKPIATMPVGGLNDKDKEVLTYLEKACIHMVHTAIPGIHTRFEYVLERFNVVGLPPPEKDWNIRRTKARLIEVMGLMEDTGIFVNEESDDGPGDTKGSAASAE